MHSLQQEISDDSDIGLAVLYCNYKDRHVQNPKDLVASICAQLIRKKGLHCKETQDLYDDLTKDGF